ncbi:MAG: hypothetical protein A2504_16300 [Bdellovibrionales bacterium RIFOXYD12_FULL_39_22]|nr:MAG: hypothetical protein A2385_08210 [Bdellovibrionales bacterium RIFOXYB1_FULL_39_21]OFZ44028.1 MAG: hypothetical protein A2485_07875 [Bdellovibrionales bacterium RIFOXYC12_FULL_39_17]OFZ50954.1 MAG: hypothetical protein A2404_07125 [Bdellovibrionales bacterium RIFOXYC1_FULL_39_130]OFZ78177.1 MAG: hypothetical protein A2560_02295 [Bdellovibrionales bacterium RIFOXYD1_FULL_39_84]OFZ94045.1 MAG: hypothetical protein A2504_16300 [Bdellovibrionales bacterium RIFOXYD12_FULL_39_22]HLE11612.1 hy
MQADTTKEFDDWYETVSIKEQVQIDARVSRIEEYDHLGDWKYLDDGVAELRRKNAGEFILQK